MSASTNNPDNVRTLSFIVSEFPTAMPEAKEALGYMKETGWAALTGRLQSRREGPKDGPNLVFARFKLEPDSKRVRRLKVNVEARTAIALDVDGNKETGEIAPALRDTCNRITEQGWAAAIYTSHSHRPEAPRYRIVLPLSAEIPANLPAVEAVAEILELSGVLDTSKLGASSVFYLPSAAPGCADHHQTIALDGSPIDAAWIQEQAGTILEAREARQAEMRAAALAAAEARRAAKVAAGFKPTENLIEAIRDRLDLAGELLKHGYTKIGDRYLYPQSETGIPGVHILRGYDGVERCFSHHSGDPLAAGNLPTWCTTKGAIDAVDVAAILDFGGDFTKALHELAKRFDIGDRATKQPPEEPPGFGDVPPPDDESGFGAICTNSAGPLQSDPRLKAHVAPSSEDAGDTPAGWMVTCPTTLLHRPIPPRRWIVDGWLPAATVTIDFGDGGVGKTLLAQQLMVSTCTSKPWCGLAVEQCRSLALFCEDDEGEIHRRQDAINRAYGVDFDDLAGMEWISGVGHDNTLAVFDSNRKMVLTPAFDTLRTRAMASDVKLIVIDTAADTYGGNENERREVRQFVGAALGKLAKETGAAVLLNAHPSRTGLAANGDLDGGSTAWSNTARSRWSLARPKADGDEQADADARILTKRKANYSSIGDTIKLRWQNGVLVPPNAATGFAAMAEQADAEAVFLALLSRFDGENRPLSDSKHSPNYAPTLFSQRPDRQGIGRKDFAAAMQRLFAAGRITMQAYGRPGDMRRRVAEVQNATP
jgi:RecA-family ATPase